MRLFKSPLFLSWIVVFLSLSLMLKSGLYSDDLPNFQLLKSGCYKTYPEAFEWFKFQNQGVMNWGRLTTIGMLESNIVYWVSDSVFAFKLWILLFNLVAIYMFTCLMTEIGLGALIPLALLIYSGSIQFYVNSHDAFTSLHALYPFVCILLFSAILAFIRAMRLRSINWLMLSVFLTSLGILCSEAFFVIYPILFLLSIMHSPKWGNKIPYLIPHLMLIIIYGVSLWYLKSHATVIYEGIVPNFDPYRMFETFKVQSWAAVPLASLTNAPEIPIQIWKSFLTIWPLLILILLPLYALVRQYERLNQPVITEVERLKSVSIGALLWFFPAALIMMSKKYQHMPFGNGYLPVYIENFGVCLLLTLLSNYLYNTYTFFKEKVYVLTLYLFAFIACIVLLFNNAKIDKCNLHFIQSTYFYQQLKSGLLSTCEEGATLYLPNQYLGDYSKLYENIYYCIYGRHYHVIINKREMLQKVKDSQPMYWVDNDENSCTAALYRIHSDGSISLCKYIALPSPTSTDYFDLITTPI